MIDWSRVALDGTLLLGCVIRILTRRRMEREQAAESERDGSGGRPMWGEFLFIGAILLTLTFEFLPVTPQTRRIVALIALIAAVYAMISVLTAVFRSRKDRNEDGRG